MSVEPGPWGLPARAAVQRLCEAVGRRWDDVTVVMADKDTLRAVTNVCRARPAVAVLTSPGAGPGELAAGLQGWERTFVVAEDLGGPDERITEIDAALAAAMPWPPTDDVVLCLGESNSAARAAAGWHAGGEPTPLPGGWALPAQRYSHREGMLAAAEVRAVVLAKLAPRPGMLVWDVGAGSGAVAVDCARLGSAALAVERDPGQCVRVIANAAAHGVEVCVVEGVAPEVLDTLPDPDAIFVGGGGPGVVAACAGTSALRVVVVLTELDEFTSTRDALTGNGFTVEGCHLSVTGVGESGSLGRSNHVFLLHGSRA